MASDLGMAPGELMGWAFAGWVASEVVYQPWREARRDRRERAKETAREEAKAIPEPVSREGPEVVVEVWDPDVGDWRRVT